MIYVDKQGNEIKEGMTIKHLDGTLEKIYACGDDDDLGVYASSKAFLKTHPDATEQFYPLYQFNLKEWEIFK